MIRVHNPNPMNLIKIKAGAAIKKGQLLTFSSGTAILATAAVATAIVVGVALEDCASGQTALVQGIDSATVLEIDFIGITQKTLTDSDFGKLFDLYVDDGNENNMVLDIDDTTGAYLAVVGYNNDHKKAYVKVPATMRYF